MKKKEFKVALRGKTLDLMTCVEKYPDCWRTLCQNVMDLISELDIDCSVVTNNTNGKLSKYEIYFYDDNSGKGQNRITYDEFVNIYKSMKDKPTKVICMLGNEELVLEQIQYTDPGLGMKLYWKTKDGAHGYVTNMKGELVR